MLISCLERLRNLATNDARFPFCEEEAILLDDILQRLDVWAADVRGSEDLEDVLAWICQINHTATAVYALVNNLNKATESVEDFLNSDGEPKRTSSESHWKYSNHFLHHPTVGTYCRIQILEQTDMNRLHK